MPLKKLPQRARAVMMIRPTYFGYNSQTSASNVFQKKSVVPLSVLRKAALAEFEALAKKLRGKGVRVFVFDDTFRPHTPDAVFPNNWISFHCDGSIVLYPMMARARRSERRYDIPEALRQKGFRFSRIIDLSVYEKANMYLEGTGSLVFDHSQRMAYASVSERTWPVVAEKLCSVLGYSLVLFDTSDSKGVPVYHTNVLLSLGKHFAVYCPDVIVERDKRRLEGLLKKGRKHVLGVTEEQMNCFACNILELENHRGEAVLAMSSAAFHAFSSKQQKTLASCAYIVHSPIPYIEQTGGGSVRCMLAEVFSPQHRKTGKLFLT